MFYHNEEVQPSGFTQLLYTVMTVAFFAFREKQFMCESRGEGAGPISRIFKVYAIMSYERK